MTIQNHLCLREKYTHGKGREREKEEERDRDRDEDKGIVLDAWIMVVQ